MSRDPELRLADIVKAGSKIEEYIAGFTYDAFRSDSKTQDAVIRQFEIVGEAVMSLPEAVREESPEIPWRNISGFRDVLAHGYFAVDDLVVWDAATSRAPQLKHVCERLLRDVQRGQS